ncbi:unnamed protein product, partial [Symbiodinium pilosum]
AMSKPEKDKEIRRNKGKARGRGHRFPVVVSEKVSLNDSMELAKERDFINIRQFRHECKKRWGYKKAKAKELRKQYLGDSKIAKAEDQQ